MQTLILLLIIALSIFIIASLLFVIIPFLFGAAYEPTRKKQIEEMIEMTNPKQTDKMVDLGSGDGKIVIEFAKQGIESHGYEINPLLVLWSKHKIKKLNLQNKAFIHWKNFWKQNLSDFNIVVVFQFFHLMKGIQNKILKESKSEVKLISNKWKIPNLKPTDSKKDLFLYKLN